MRATNHGARIQHAQANWESLPSTIERAVDSISSSIRPPLADDGFKRTIARAASSFKNAIRHSVTEHLVAKYSAVRRQLTTLDPRDRRQATDIARRQILRANQRITAARVDGLLEIVLSDSTADGSWQLARGRHSSRASSIQAPIHVETDNRFLPLADMEEDANDQFNHSDLLDILETEVEPHSEVVPPHLRSEGRPHPHRRRQRATKKPRSPNRWTFHSRCHAHLGRGRGPLSPPLSTRGCP